MSGEHSDPLTCSYREMPSLRASRSMEDGDPRNECFFVEGDLGERGIGLEWSLRMVDERSGMFTGRVGECLGDVSDVFSLASIWSNSSYCSSSCIFARACGIETTSDMDWLS